MQSVPITTNVVSSNPVYGEVYSIQHYVIKCVSDFRQVGGFLGLLWCPPSKKLTAIGKNGGNGVKHHKPIRVIAKLPNSEQSYKGKVKTHNYINRQNQSTTGKL